MTSITTQSSKNNRTILQWGAIFILSLVLGFGGSFLLTSGFVGETAVALGINEQTPWYFTRAAGTIAYLLLAGSMVWGLLLSSKLIKETMPPVLALAMHNILSWLAVTLTGLHALALLFDNYYSYTVANLLIPFSGPYRANWVGLGTFGFYLMLIITVSFYFRKQLGQKRWRMLHMLSFVAYIMATLHGIMAGTDSSNPGMTVIYWGSGLLILFLTNFRLLMPRIGRGRS